MILPCRILFCLLSSLTLLLQAEDCQGQKALYPDQKTTIVEAFRDYIAKYNKSALEHVFSLDLNKAFSLVDNSYQFHPQEHSYLFEFDMPVPLEMRKQFIAKYFLKPGDCAIDVGAFLGTYSFFYNSLVTNEGSVIAFEPNPTPHHAFKEILLQRGDVNILLESKALSRKAGKMIVMEVHPGTLRQNSTVETAFMNRTPGPSTLIHVETESLDHMFASGNHQIANLKLIKIDTEGHETAILKGGRRLIRSLRPVIIFEYGTDPGVFEPKSIQILEELGYVCYDLMNVHAVHPGYQHLTGTDLLGIPSEKLDEFKQHIKPLLRAIK